MIVSPARFAYRLVLPFFLYPQTFEIGKVYNLKAKLLFI